MTHWKAAHFLFVLFMTLTSQQSVTSREEANIIPDNFPVANIAEYKVRYLSAEQGGKDTNSCLSDQLYPPNSSNATVQYCQSLLYALTGGQDFHSDSQSNIVVLLAPGSYPMGDRGIEINNFQNVVLRKMPGTSGEVIVRCNAFLEEGFNNLFVTNATNLALYGIVFTECGPHRSPIRIQNTFNLTVSDCIFRNNRICGLTIDGSAQALIVNSAFHDNNSTTFYTYSDQLDPAVFRFGGGLLLSWNSTEDDQPLPSTTAIVRNCTFFNNYAGIDERNSGDNRPSFYRPRGHGGAIVVAFKNTDNHTLMIENCRIYDNTALFGGGGIILSFFRTASKNTVIINGTAFENNVCSTKGGAINMNAFEMANGNALVVMNSNFTANEATDGGGACSINLRDNLQMEMSEVKEQISNTATFINCSFSNNTSLEGAGSAVHLISNLRVDQVVTATEFTNCNFSGNEAKRQSAVLSFRYPIVFSGRNSFKRNQGGGVTLQQTNMDVGGTLLFADNYAKAGGAVALEDLCVIYLLEGSKIVFVRNSAETQGGAISALFPSVSNVFPIFNARCFIQYKGDIELDSSEWNTSLVFINNTAAMDGAAIYATSIDQCRSISTRINITGATNFESSIFQVSPPFKFSGNKLSTVTERNVVILATAPSDLIVTPQSITAAPGETVQFFVQAIDQAGNTREAIWSVTEKSESEEEADFVDDVNVGDYFGSLASGINHSVQIQKLNKDVYHTSCSTGIPRSVTFSLVQAIAGDVNTGTKVNVTVTCCHPGYHFDNETETCDHNHNDTTIIRPDPNNRYLYTKDNIYVDTYSAPSNMTETLKTAVIPPTFHHCDKQGAQPGCKFRFDSVEAQCSAGRSGFLCGQCPANQGVDLTLRQCRNCTIPQAIAVAVIVLAFIITSLLVLYFNIGIPNELKGCLFYVQVVGFVYQSSRTDIITWDYHLSRLFGSGLYLPLCPAPGYTALSTALYGLMFSLLAISILIIYIISARFSKHLSSRTSFDGIWFLSIIIYKYMADTCFILLRCQKVSGRGSSRSGEFVYYFDGTVQCFQSRHLYISIVALFLSVIVVVPFPLLIFLISFRRFKFTQPFTDVLNKDIKVSCRWWSGFDLLRRLLFITVVFFFNYIEPRYTQLALFISGLLTFTIFASAKPYQTWWANIIEAAILLNLLLLTGLFLNVNLSKVSKTERISEQILLLLPFLFAIVYIAVHLSVFIWKRYSRKSFKMFFGDLIEMKGKQRTNLSHSLEVIKNMTNEGNSESNSDNERDTPLYREELILDN